MGVQLPVLCFWENNKCLPEQMLEWEAEDLLPIDIGDEKYHESGYGSATHRIVEFFGLTGEAVEQVVDLMNRNNAKGGGFLKSGNALSVAWTVRE